jgi:hypothetical protein
MEAIIAGSCFCIFAIGVFIFAHTKTGKKFLDEKK